ncbi:MAG TPA: tRNA (adenosine(37)-N6)-dimethylallyltransferase MiaA [Bacteroidia bacterium]|nr:tRNA (adenosine(37)-N6)-dimethylallyltransferase MiaA [Bacteroidia bacterium]
MSKLLVVVAGPTASGKTQLAIDLAKHFHTVVVSADSRQFYQEISIGTAKPSQEELAEVTHYFIDSHSVRENFSAGMFAESALEKLKQLFLEHDVVILTGGSGLYIDAIINGIDQLPNGNEDIRNELNRILMDEGLIKLQLMLKETDPDSFDKIDILNPRRVIRALEVTITSGIPYSALLGKKEDKLPWNLLMTGIDWPREELYNRINLRTSAMIKNGLKDEAIRVLPYREQNALKTVGYKEMFNHLDGLLTIQETEMLIAKNTRNYAKRQMTWFRRYPEMIWMNPDKTEELISLIEEKLKSN